MATAQSDAASSAMFEIAQEHERLELLFEFERLMDTLVERPVYYWFPRGIRIEGRPAVVEMYKRLQPMIAALGESIGAGTRAMDYFAIGADQIAAEVQFDYRLSTGVERRVRIAAFVPFEDGRMVGETQYVDRYLAEEIDRLLGDDFTALPGVSII